MDGILRLGEATVCIREDWQIVRTTFRDGLYCELYYPGIPPTEARQYADKLGYSGDPWEHYRVHEVLHSWLAVRQGQPVSLTLWAVSHPGHPAAISRKRQGMEEWLVTDFQRYLQTGEPGRSFGVMVRGANLAVWRAEALEFLAAQGLGCQRFQG